MQTITFPEGYRYDQVVHDGKMFWVEVRRSGYRWAHRDVVALVNQNSETRFIEPIVAGETANLNDIAPLRQFINHPKHPGLSIVWLGHGATRAIHCESLKRFKPIGARVRPRPHGLMTPQDFSTALHGWTQDNFKDWLIEATVYQRRSYDDNTIALCGEYMKTLTPILLGPTRAKEILPDSKTIVQSVLIIKRHGDTRLMRLPPKDKPIALRLSPDGLTLFVGCNRTAFVIDVDQ